MKYYLYILKSISHNKTYVGCCNNLVRRLKEHNSGKSKFTSRFAPWKIIYKEELDTYREARAREKYFKSGAGRMKMKQILNEYSEIV